MLTFCILEKSTHCWVVGDSQLKKTKRKKLNNNFKKQNLL